MKLIVKTTFTSIEYVCSQINNYNLAHLVLSMVVEPTSRVVVVFRAHTSDEENQMYGLPL